MKLLESVRDLIYPPLCPLCEESLPDGGEYCSLCQEHLNLLPIEPHCPRCFSKEYSKQKNLCGDCARRPPILNRMAAALPHEGAASNLVQRLKYANQPHLAEGMAAFMMLQWLELEWPTPTAIVAVPMAPAKKAMRGYNQAQLLADAFGKLIQLPVVNALKKGHEGVAQAGKRRKERLQVGSELFHYRTDCLPSDQTILLIDDVMTTGSTLRRCGEALLESYPQAIYSLTFTAAV